MQVVFFQRKPYKTGSFSIESYFERLRQALPADIQVITSVSRFHSKGFFPRLYNALEAMFRQGEINHVTGDVHYLTLFLKKYKTILTIHDLGFIETSSNLKHFLLKLFWLTLPARKCHFITTVSQTTKTELLKHISFPSDRIFVIPVFVSAIFQPFSKDFNEKNPRILQIGTAPNKNILRLAEALEGISCILVIIGRLSEEQIAVLEKYKINYENFFGLTDTEILKQYQLCDIVTLISTLEGFGMPIVEANCVERVVITSNISSMPEVASNAAQFTNPFDMSEMHKNILQVIENQELREKLLENGRQNRQRFQANTIAESYLELYKKIV